MIVQQDSHSISQSHLQMLLVSHMAGLVFELDRRASFNHLWVREEEERETIPMDVHVVNLIMRGEKVRNLYPWGPAPIAIVAHLPNLMTTPQCFLFPCPCRLYGHQLWQYQVKEMDLGGRS